MSDEAKVTMLLYSGLLPDEQRKLESLDNAIATTDMAPVSRTVRMLTVVGKDNVSWGFRVPVPLLCCSG